MNKGRSLFDIVRLFRNVCTQHPLVNDFFEGVYGISSADNITYSLIALTVQNVTRQSGTSPYLTYTVNLLYADRLTENRDNRLAIQSTGITVLSEIINAIESLDQLTLGGMLTFSPFTEQFADNCAGVVTTLSIQVADPIGDCYWLDTECFEC
jgi:hypothetical protein